MSNAPTTDTLTLEIDPSLLKHVRKRLKQKHRNAAAPEEVIAALITTLLDNSGYPISAKRMDDDKIRIRY